MTDLSGGVIKKIKAMVPLLVCALFFLPSGGRMVLGPGYGGALLSAEGMAGLR